MGRLPKERQLSEARLMNDSFCELGREEFPRGVEREDVGLVAWGKETGAHDVDNALRSVVALKPVMDDRCPSVEQVGVQMHVVIIA
jgi:hypothetical protein